MALPHHSIILYLTSTGQGAAAWIMWRREDMSYFVLVASGRANRRWNWVGTMCEQVTLYFSISCSISSGTHLSITTMVWPRWIDAPENRITAVWSSGEPTMWTLSSW